MSEEIVEMSTIYDSIDEKDQKCPIGLTYNANGKNNGTNIGNNTNETSSAATATSCVLNFTVKEDLQAPVLIYYEITNFHQNHRSYAGSRDDYQLAGLPEYDATFGSCEPLYKLGDVKLNPCGLIANTFFNDVIKLRENSANITMVEEGIAWKSDVDFRFAMPEGYDQAPCPENQCDPSCCTDKGFSCTEPEISTKDGICYAYHYPNEDTTQYLYETYPNIISPLEHVTNEHFIVWMRVATRPTFRKLYGYIEQDIPAGTELLFDIELNYVVQSFGGSKALVLSTNGMLGGKNPYLGPTFYCMGFFCLACGILFATKHWFRPRKIADRKYLQYKED